MEGKESVSSFHPRSAQLSKSPLLLSFIVGLQGSNRIYILALELKNRDFLIFPHSVIRKLRNNSQPNKVVSGAWSKAVI